MLGSWIKAMVENLENLPIILILPKMDKKWEVKMKLVRNGLPNQCAKCKATNDQMWDYPQTESAMLEGEKLLGGRKRTKRP